jgi:putative transposase
MLTYEYTLDGTAAQYAAIDEGIRVGQFLRNTCLRAWMDRTDDGKSFATMSAYTAVLAQQFAFAAKLGSQARQAAAERAWQAVQRFYDNCMCSTRIAMARQSTIPASIARQSKS